MITNFTNAQVMPPGRSLLKIQECDKLNKTIRDPLNTDLAQWVHSIGSTGFIKFDLEKMQDITSFSNIEAHLGIVSPNTFTTVSETVSSLDTNITFVTTQQYFNGIYVEGGGYIEGFINCITFFMNAYIMEDINISLSPSLTKQQAISSLETYESETLTFASFNPEDDVQLVINQDLSVSCDYLLSWKISYLKGSEPKTAFVNATNENVYKVSSLNQHIDAPTVDYGTVILQDDLNFPETFYYLRTPNSTVITFDKSTSNEAGIKTPGFPGPYAPFQQENIPSSFSAWPIIGDFANDPATYQAHHVTTNVVDVLTLFGLNFPSTIYVAGNLNDEGAGYFPYTDTNGGNYEVVYYGRIDPGNDDRSYALYDVAGHEMTHMFLKGRFNNEGEINGIEESICDIFGEYAETEIKEETDWIGAGENGINTREFENPTIPIYFPTIGEEDDEHDIAGPMNRWFRLLVEDETVTYNGLDYYFPEMDITEVTNIVRASIGFLQFSSDYYDVRAATLMVAEFLYGECSDEVNNIAAAWHVVGVGGPSCEILIGGSRDYCEEYLVSPGPNVHLSILYPLSNHYYEWTYNLDWHAIGENAPQTHTGTSVHFYEYSNMTWFPRHYNIYVKEYDSNNVLQRTKTVEVTIHDCDGDDPNPCEPDDPVFFQNGDEISDLPQQNISFNNSNVLISGLDEDKKYNYSLYDLVGREICNGDLNEHNSVENIQYFGIYILHIYDGQRNTVQVEKIFIAQ
ncbi:MAG: Zn-dependent metalloprotease [Saprospiraceae bacterium]|jgi:Zn-dependent metalloprotease